VLGLIGGEGIYLEEYSKGFGWVFYTSCVLVHGVSSCDLGSCNLIGYSLSKMIKWNELHD
jgi:hypothetical protein